MCSISAIMGSLKNHTLGCVAVVVGHLILVVLGFELRALCGSSTTNLIMGSLKEMYSIGK
jgi:hypothetical protein